MKLTKEQFDTLKAFDLEMFKNGVKLITPDMDSAEYVTHNDNTGQFVVKSKNEYFGVLPLRFFKTSCLKMLPLFFVEHKPVYPGDVLYDAESGTEVEVRSATGDEQGTYLTWNKPKVKKEAWVNLYRCVAISTGVDLGSLYPTEDIALKTANGVASYIRTIRIEWEE